MTNLNAMTASQLVDVYNGLAERPIKSWSKAKDELVGRIEALKEAIDAAPPSDGKASKEGAIKRAALELLSHVDYHEDKATGERVPATHANARSVGLPYATVLERIREQFPGAATSIACLRWYQVKMNVGEKNHAGYRVPGRRPRAKAAKKAA